MSLKIFFQAQSQFFHLKDINTITLQIPFPHIREIWKAEVIQLKTAVTFRGASGMEYFQTYSMQLGISGLGKPTLYQTYALWNYLIQDHT